MKRGTKTRTLGLTISTVNPCNNFIVDFLLRNKIKSDKQILCKSYLYNLAIQSVRKYPLPLICVQQLDALEGFGDFFINQIGRIIRRQYLRGRNPTEEEMQKDDADHFKALRTRSQYVQEKNRFNRQRVDHNRDLDSLYQDEATSNVSNATSMSYDSKGRHYRPKKNSQSYNVLEAMVELKADIKSITKGQINEYFYNNHKNKISSWYIVKQKLLDYQFIEAGQGNCDDIYLTQKGKQCITKYDELRKKKDRRKKKILEEVQEQNDSFEKSSKENQSAENEKQSNSKKEKDKQSQNSKSDTNNFSGGATTALKKLNILTGLHVKNQEIVPNLKTFTLLISTKNQNVNQIQQHLQDSNIKHKCCHLELGSFVWSVQSKIINYVAFRIKVSKFEEQDFISQCLRVKSVSLKFVYFIVEGKQEDYECEERQRILACARVSGFNVFKTDSIQGTLKLISQITNLIMRNIKLCQNSEVNIGNFKIRLNQQLKGFEHYGCLEEFNSKLLSPFKLQNVTAKMIKQIPNLSRGEMSNLLKKIGCFSLLYRKLNELTEKQRKKKLKGYLGDKDTEKGIKTILYLVFKQEY